jgi:hypothetical protein
MKRSAVLVTVLSAVLALASLPALAQRGHGGGGGGGLPPSGGPPSEGTRGPSGTRPGDTTTKTGTTTGQKSPGELLTQNKKLASKLQGLLPACTNLQQAAQGSKNLGQFVAAVHVSHNLDIPFDQLKAKMTGANAESLGKAIQDLKPGAKAKAEAKKAKKQADRDMHETGS